MQIAQQNPGAGDGVPGVNFQARELFQREHPAAERNAPAREAGARAGNGYRHARRRRLRATPRLTPASSAGMITRSACPRKPEASSRYCGRYTSRITGMISGRREVSFTM